jgi:hypothetical protein
VATKQKTEAITIKGTFCTAFINDFPTFPVLFKVSDSLIDVYVDGEIRYPAKRNQEHDAAAVE